MKKLFILATLLLLTISHKMHAQTVMVITDSLTTIETPGSYFFKRTDGKYNAVSIKVVGANGERKVLVTYTAPASAAAKPQLIKLKFTNGKILSRPLKFIRRLGNDNPGVSDNLFAFTATAEDIEQMQNVTLQSIVLLSAQQTMLVEIPVTDGRALQEHLQHIKVQKEN